MEKILIIHNEYQQLGGEDIAVNKEIDILSNHFEVETLIFNNNLKNKISLLFSFLLVTNFYSNYLLKNKLKQFNPDLVYVHNTWFKASLGIFNILKKKNIKTVVKLHNFRYFCTKSFFKFHHVKKGDICHACGASGDRFLFNKYFSNSLLKSLFVIRYGKKYFKILKQKDLLKIVLTNHHKKFLKEIDIVDGVFVNPNFKPNFNKSVTNEKENLIVYAGRISKEKGVDIIIKSFKNSDLQSYKLKIIGKGPCYDQLKKEYQDEKIEFLGEISNSQTLEIISNAKAVITATKLFEGQPTLLCEASSLGAVSIFPKTGGISEFFPKDNKFSFNQFDYEDLTKKINLLKDNDEVNKQSVMNKKYIEEYLNEEKLIKNFSNDFL